MAQILSVQPVATKQSLHPSITEEQISELVETFYEEISQQPRLAPIFEQNIQADWNDHLDKMKMFWRSVLLRTGEYQGRPVPAHQRIDGLSTEDFEIWLSLFTPICVRVFNPEASAIVVQTAKRIATSLWLSRSNNIFAEPPTWSNDQSVATNMLKGLHRENS